MSDIKSADERARDLHDRATRGIELSAEEQADLDAWYAAQDRAESAVLRVDRAPQVAELQAQVNEALARLRQAAERVQQLAAENQSLRDEIAMLERRLTERRPAVVR